MVKVIFDTYYNAIFIKEIELKMSYAGWQAFCQGLNMLWGIYRSTRETHGDNTYYEW